MFKLIINVKVIVKVNTKVIINIRRNIFKALKN